MIRSGNQRNQRPAGNGGKFGNRGGGGNGGGQRPGGFVYKKRDAAAVKERAERSGRDYDSPVKDGIDVWKPKEGDNCIRVLPPTWEGAEHFGYSVHQHTDIGPDGGIYNCLSSMLGQPDPIDEAMRDTDDRDEQKKLKTKEAVYAWIIDRDEKEGPTPRLYRMGWSTDRDLVAQTINKRTGEVLYIDDPDNGYDISFTRIGKGLNTRYIGWQVDRAPSPICDDQKKQDQILEFVTQNPVPDCMNYYSYEHIDNVFNGVQQQADADLDQGGQQGSDQGHEGGNGQPADDPNYDPVTGEYIGDDGDQGGDGGQDDRGPEEPPFEPDEPPARTAAPARQAPARQAPTRAAPQRQAAVAQAEDEGDEGDEGEGDEGLTDGADAEAPSRPQGARQAPARQATAPARQAAPQRQQPAAAPARQVPARTPPARTAAPAAPARQVPARTPPKPTRR